MDPTTCLAELRELLKQAYQLATAGSAVPKVLAMEIAERFDALDTWLSRGGFPPVDWTPAAR